MLYRAGRDGSFQPVDMSTFANSTSLNDQEDFISALHDQLEQQDIPIEQIHAESAPGQLEVVLNHSNDVLQLADDILFARETITACAKQYGMKALFLPKISENQAGNGLHLHFSFHDGSCDQTNSFSDPTRLTGISSKGESFVEGILEHLPSLLSFSLPTVNSFRRMGPGCWTGHEVGWSIEDKEVPIRVCLDLKARNVTNVEYKLSDATANIYLELAMVLSAGLQGMKHRKKLRPMVGDVAASYQDVVSVNSMPTSLQTSIDILKADDFLLSILGSALSTAYIAVRESEASVSSKKSLEDEVADALKRS
jgi:glutamine synthetase